MTKEDIIQMSSGVSEPDQATEAKAAFVCLVLFVAAIIGIAVLGAVFHGISSILLR